MRYFGQGVEVKICMCFGQQLVARWFSGRQSANSFQQAQDIQQVFVPSWPVKSVLPRTWLSPSHSCLFISWLCTLHPVLINQHRQAVGPVWMINRHKLTALRLPMQTTSHFLKKFNTFVTARNMHGLIREACAMACDTVVIKEMIDYSEKK